MYYWDGDHTKPYTIIPTAEDENMRIVMPDGCHNCKYRFELKKYDYRRGCKHTNMQGFICLAFTDDGFARWMVGLDKDNSKCECWKRKEDT